MSNFDLNQNFPTQSGFSPQECPEMAAEWIPQTGPCHAAVYSDGSGVIRNEGEGRIYIGGGSSIFRVKNFPEKIPGPIRGVKFAGVPGLTTNTAESLGVFLGIIDLVDWLKEASEHRPDTKVGTIDFHTDSAYVKSHLLKFGKALRTGAPATLPHWIFIGTVLRGVIRTFGSRKARVNVVLKRRNSSPKMVVVDYWSRVARVMMEEFRRDLSDCSFRFVTDWEPEEKYLSPSRIKKPDIDKHIPEDRILPCPGEIGESLFCAYREGEMEPYPDCPSRGLLNFSE